MSPETLANYNRHFGPAAFVPGYCGKCPASALVDGGPVCSIYEEDDGLLAIGDCVEPPEKCPIRHISTRYTTAVDEQTIILDERQPEHECGLCGKVITTYYCKCEISADSSQITDRATYSEAAGLRFDPAVDEQNKLKVGKRIPCPSGECDKLFRNPHAAGMHWIDKHGVPADSSQDKVELFIDGKSVMAHWPYPAVDGRDPDHEPENSMCACPTCINEGWEQQSADSTCDTCGDIVEGGTHTCYGTDSKCKWPDCDCTVPHKCGEGTK